MGANTKIEWCDHTFNPWRGCTKVAHGCKFCYAEVLAKRNPAVLGIWGDQGTRVVASDSMWRQPLKWAREAQRVNEEVAAADALDTYGTWRPRVFCGSMCDVFEDRPELEEPRLRLLGLIEKTRELDWLILTKRPENVLRLLDVSWDAGGLAPAIETPQLPSNVWLGTSIACQEDADRNIPKLLEVPAAVRFLSIEPLVGPVDLGDDFWESGNRVDWIIVGGESGPHARPCDVAWIRSIVEQARTALVPVFVKQLGARPIVCAAPLPSQQSAESIMRHGEYDPDPWEYEFRDPKGGDPAEWPEDLRVREFPGVPR